MDSKELKSEQTSSVGTTKTGQTSSVGATKTGQTSSVGITKSEQTDTPKIVGLKSNNKLGIMSAFEMKFNPEVNRLVAFKGDSGSGKTTTQRGIKLLTNGKKVLKDTKLYGNIDLELQILIGEHNLFAGCKVDANGDLEFSMYERDLEGKIKMNPTINGIKCTPSAWQNLMQTQLTWNYEGLFNENPTEHRNTLLKLFQDKLEASGVIFDKNSSAYEGTILHKIDKAIEVRSRKDGLRKEVGGIAEDLKKNYNINVDKKETVPQRVDVSVHENTIANLNQEIGTLSNTKQSKLDAIKLEASELKNRALKFNQQVDSINDLSIKVFNDIFTHNEKIESAKQKIKTILQAIEVVDEQLKATDATYQQCIWSLDIAIDNKKKECNVDKPVILEKIIFENDKIKEYLGTSKDAIDIITVRNELVRKFIDIDAEAISFDDINEKINNQKIEIIKAKEVNKICDACDAFYDWQDADITVKKLNDEYIKLLSKVNIGINGFMICPEGDNIFLMYNASYDPKYFGNEKKEYRKITSYSGSQKPLICLLLQNNILNSKPEAMRYVFIDDVPIDKKTYKLLEEMCEKLNLWVFVNINGDFEAADLRDGEILFNGGEILLPKMK